MQYIGALQKMITMPTSPVKYTLEIGDDFLMMNQLIGKKMAFNFNGKYVCNCGLDVTRVYRANFCFECYISKPEAGESIFRPELSKAHLGIADRDLAFEQRYQLQPHIVYLANSGGVKVGVTRARQMQTRWMDQGATSAIVLAEVPNRFLAGCIEVELKNHISDKTHWQRMLKNEGEEADLTSTKIKLIEKLPQDLRTYTSDSNEIYTFAYPVPLYPTKVSSVNLVKSPTFEAMLSGIRGQYLLFENGQVMNVRSHEGYVVALDIG